MTSFAYGASGTSQQYCEFKENTEAINAHTTHQLPKEMTKNLGVFKNLKVLQI